MKPHGKPRALETHEIKAIIGDFGQATQRALEAGFDGVELHAASGYLPMQFLSTGANRRSDEYGGSVQNRARFVVETLDEMIRVAGADRVGIKISPEMAFNDISDADPRATYTTLVKAISGKGLAYLHVTPYGKDVDYHALLRPLFEGAYFAGAGLDQAQAEALVDSGKVDAAVFGGLFLANPDLPRRFLVQAPLNVPHQATFYAGGAKGYIDYPELEMVAA
jgi:N-ethylmaleimide reductase